MTIRRHAVALALLLSIASACASDPHRVEAPRAEARDLHSHARPWEVRTVHLDLDLRVDFERRVLGGTATHHLERAAGAGDAPLVLDAKGLRILACRAGGSGGLRPATFRLEAEGEAPGEALIVELDASDDRVEVAYETTEAGSGLQWLEPRQTSGNAPFLFSQSQAIHARTWIPCQDSPAVRVTYDARVVTPPGLEAVMSAEKLPTGGEAGVHRFRMPQPVPSYLIALAVGDLAFRAMSERTGVWAEPAVVESAASEFRDTEAMMRAAERLYGPYRWGRYDLLVLPPSFPFGGMENPRLTFVTPTVLAGDRSLVALIAHELAHSWSGNLVTNATHRDFWLNEGFTVYIERRLMEEVYGPERARMEAALGFRDLTDEMAELEPRDEILHVDLAGRDPDEGFTNVPYEKGALFLTRLEEVFGRETFDAFLRRYFDRFAFRSITTAEFRAFLETELFADRPEAARRIDLDVWIEQPGIPEDAPIPSDDAFAAVDRARTAFVTSGVLPVEEAADWGTHAWLHFLRGLDAETGAARLEALDEAFDLTRSRNSEILAVWLELAIRNDYRAADAALEAFLVGQGRRKFLEPLYGALIETEAGRERARILYARARPGYHAISRTTIDRLLDEE